VDGLNRALLVLIGGLLLVGCGHGDGLPARLFGGLAPSPVPHALRHLDDPLVTTVRLRSGRLLGAAFAECAAPASASFAADTKVVERRTVLAHSITFLDDNGEWVYGCVATGGRHDGRARWCARAVGRRAAGRLLDPRLDIICESDDRRPVATAWVEPLPRARWIAVDQGPFTELYETLGGLPVRIASSRAVDREGSHASFQLAEYDRGGGLLIRTDLEAYVAG
jgi:hypothetical protein